MSASSKLTIHMDAEELQNLIDCNFVDMGECQLFGKPIRIEIKLVVPEQSGEKK